MESSPETRARPAPPGPGRPRPPEGTGPPETVTRKARQVLALVCFATFMSALDSSIVNVAYPTLTAALQASVATIGWVGVSFLLVRTTLTTVFGRLSDMVGHKRIYMAGFVVFLVGSALSGQAWSAGALIFFRCVQAAGAAMLTANSLAIVALQYPRARMGSAIAMFEASVSVALGIGPVLGGILIQEAGWRSIFYVNVPIALAALVLAGRILPPMAPSGPSEPFDFTGAGSFAAGLVGVLLAANLAPEQGWGAPEVLALLIGGLGLLALFVVFEGRQAHPMIDLGLFRVRAFAAANAAKIFCYASTFAVSFGLPFYLEDLLGYAPAKLGVSLLPLPVAMGLGSLLGGPLSDRLGSRLLAPLGMGLAAVGSLLFARATPAGGYPPLLIAMLALEFGTGLFIAPNDGLIMKSAPAARSGVASGILALTRGLGMIFGITFAATVFQAFVGNRPAGAGPVSAAMGAALLGGFHLVFLITVAICVVGGALSAVR